jgi:YD repeat-containing protein
VVDALGNRTSTVYTSLGQVQAEVDALGNRITHSYDSGGNRIATTDALGKITSFVSVQLDITRELRLERELQQAERLAAIGQTITGVAHYLKNVCNNIRCSSTLIDRAIDNQQPNMLPPIWAAFKRNAGRISTLAEQMLEYSRIQELTIHPVDLNNLLTEIREHSLAQAAQQNVRIELELCEGLSLVPCDSNGAANLPLTFCAPMGGFLLPMFVGLRGRFDHGDLPQFVQLPQ